MRNFKALQKEKKGERRKQKLLLSIFDVDFFFDRLKNNKESALEAATADKTDKERCHVQALQLLLYNGNMGTLITSLLNCL